MHADSRVATDISNGYKHKRMQITYGTEFISMMTTTIPGWIMNGSMLVKRQFLSGFQGAVGGMVRWDGKQYECRTT